MPTADSAERRDCAAASRVSDWMVNRIVDPGRDRLARSIQADGRPRTRVGA